MSWLQQHEELQTFAQAIEPKAQLIAVSWLKERAITVGSRQLYPASWSASQVRELIPHECRHSRQMRELGLLKFLILYLLVLPILWAPHRVNFEIEAEVARWRLLTGDDRMSRIGDSARELVAALSSWRYGWAARRGWLTNRVAEEVSKITRT